MSETTIPFGPASGIHLADSFLAHTAITDGVVGELGWNLTTIANASTMEYLDSTLSVNPGGGMRFTTAANGSDGEAMHLGADTVTLSGQGGYFKFRVRYPSVAGNVLAANNFRIGLDDSVTATAPTVGIWVTSAAGVITLEADSADHGDFSAAAAGVSTLTSGTTMVLGTWHDFEVKFNGTNAQGGPDSAYLYVDGELASSITTVAIDNDEEMEPKVTHWDGASSSTLELDLAYYELLLHR